MRDPSALASELVELHLAESFGALALIRWDTLNGHPTKFMRSVMRALSIGGPHRHVWRSPFTWRMYPQRGQAWPHFRGFTRSGTTAPSTSASAPVPAWPHQKTQSMKRARFTQREGRDFG